MPGEQDVVGEVASDDDRVAAAGDGPHVVVVDCGVKRNIVRSLVERGARVTVVPYGTPFAEIAALEPDGVIVSPGPGDPANLDAGLDVVRELARHAASRTSASASATNCWPGRSARRPTKLKFGHRGGNHPVLDLRTGQVTITSQNHGFQVDARHRCRRDDGWDVALVNLNDGSVEGLGARRRCRCSRSSSTPRRRPARCDNGVPLRSSS